MIGSISSGWMRRILLFLVLITGILLIAMFARAPPLTSLQPFTTHRIFQSPWSWICVSGRCERRAVRSSRISLATCSALCGDNTRLLWPKPTGFVDLGLKNVFFDWQQINFAIVNTSNHDVRKLLEHAENIFLANIRNLIQVSNVKRHSEIDKFIIYLSAGTAPDTKLSLDTDESYHLEVLMKGRNLEVLIIGKSYYGVRHGLETFSQMIWWNENCGKKGCLQVLSQATVEDKPTFLFRGLMVDTGRQFFSLAQLKRVIDGTDF